MDYIIALSFIAGFVIGAMWWNKQIKRDTAESYMKQNQTYFQQPKRSSGFDFDVIFKILIMLAIIVLVITSGVF